MSREIDIQIAEKIMGSTLTEISGQLLENGPSVKRPSGGGILLRRYSTDIAAAFEIVEKLASTLDRKTFRLAFRYGRWYAEFGVWDMEFVEADTAPMAVCLAALKTVEGK